MKRRAILEVGAARRQRRPRSLGLPDADRTAPELAAATLALLVLAGCNTILGFEDGQPATTTEGAGAGGAGGSAGAAGHGAAGGSGAAGGMGGAGGDCTLGSFGTPALVDGVNSGSGEWAPAVSPDHLTLYFSSDRPGGSGGWDIWYATRPTVDEPFDPPEPLNELNTADDDGDAEVSADGLTIYFTSDRTGATEGERDLWSATRPSLGEPFGAPELLAAPSSSSNERDPSVSADGLHLYFCSPRPNGLGSFDIWNSTRPSVEDPFGTVLPLAPVNSAESDRGPSISPDHLALYFGSGREGSDGLFDIWVAERPGTEHNFGEPQLLDGANSPAEDSDPALSADGLTMYFASDRSGGPGGGDLYVMTRSCL